MLNLPDRVFFTGVAGSRWSAISQMIECNPAFNTTDRIPERDYVHARFSGHKGIYFGPGMEYDSVLDAKYIEQAWATGSVGTKLIKSHHWAYQLDEIRNRFPSDWIVMVYCPDLTSYAGWFEAGGFSIAYPKYTYYKDCTTMLSEIALQNKAILEFGFKNKCVWEHFSPEWITKHFSHTPNYPMPVGPALVKNWGQVLVTIIKP